MKALFDTNILIDYLKRVDAARDEVERDTRRLVTVVTWMEMLAGTRNAAEEEVIALLITRNTKDFPPNEPGIRIPY